MNGRSSLLVSFLLASFAQMSGCASSESISDSMGSLSASLASPFESSSDSSGREGSAYYRDIESVTLAAIEARSTPSAFLSDLGRAAASHGIADWESLASTYRGVGAGLRRGGLDGDEAAAFGRRVFGESSEIEGWILEGFQS